MIRKASPKHTTGVVKGDWDAAAQQKKLPSPMMLETAYAMYGYVDTSAAEDGKVPKSACKLPHHNVSASGRPGAANATALSSAIAALNGGRGGVAGLSDSERSSVYGHLAKHMRDADLDPPPLKSRSITMARRQTGRRQRRMVPFSVRVTKEEEGLPKRFSAIVLKYLVVDDYGTRFVPKVFAESMETRMPRICWCHDWSDPIGRWVDVLKDDEEELELDAELDNFERVPHAGRAAEQIKSLTLDQFSVGFFEDEVREAGKDLPGIFDIVRGTLAEVSPVVMGAVPGTATTGMRATPSGLLVPLEEVERIIVSIAAGSLDVVDGINDARELAEPEDLNELDDEEDEGQADNLVSGNQEADEANEPDVSASADADDTAGVTQPEPQGTGAEGGEPGSEDDAPPAPADDDVMDELDKLLAGLAEV